MSVRAVRHLIPMSAVVLLLAACGGREARTETPFMGESFDSDETYSRSFETAPAKVCEAARLALLGQGYAVGKATDDAVEASKNFQPEADVHTQLSLRVSCVPQGKERTLLFVSALQDRYALKKSSSSASLGVGALGSVSLPVGSSDDSLVRVASSTVQDKGFYRRFFERVGYYVPTPEKPMPAKAPPTEDPPPADAMPHGEIP